MIAATQRHITYFAYPLQTLVQWKTQPEEYWRVVCQRVTYRWLLTPTIEYGLMPQGRSAAPEIVWASEGDLGQAPPRYTRESTEYENQ